VLALTVGGNLKDLKIQKSSTMTVRQHLFLLGFEIQNIGSIRIGHLSLQILGTNASEQSGYSTSGVSVSCYFYANAIKLGIRPLVQSAEQR
jgi:hypothetical protein